MRVNYRRGGYGLLVTPILCLLSLPAVSSAAMISGGTAAFTGTLPVSHATTSLTPPYMQFNPALGTLLAIHFDFLTSFNGNVTITDSSTVDSTVNVSFGELVNVYNVSNTTVLATASGTASASGVSVPGNGSAVVIPIVFTNVSSTSTLSNSAQFSPFIGTGTVSLPVGAVGNAQTSPGLFLPFTIDASGIGSAEVEITYEYTPLGKILTPEPATAAFVGLGLIVFGAFKMRGRRQLLR